MFLKSSFGSAPLMMWGLPSIGMKRRWGMLWMPKALAS